MHYQRGTQDPEDGRFHGGVATMVKNSTPHSRIDLQTDLQAVAVRVQLERTYTICNIYLPPRDNILRAQLEDLINQLPQPYLILGDFNARHPHWGDTVTNTRGRMIEKVISEWPICLLNTGSPTHLQIQNGSLSCLDLSICSADIVNNFQWETLQDLRGSDHFPITLTSTTPQCSMGSPRFRFSKADWTLYKARAVCTSLVTDFARIDDATRHLQDTINSAAVASIPRTGRPRQRPVPWWNDDLARAVEERKVATRRYYTTLLVADKIALKRARARSKYIARKAREESWQQYASSLNSRTPISKVWKRVKKISGKFTPPTAPTIELGGVLLTSPQEVGNAFARHLSDISRGNTQSVAFTRYKQIASRTLNSFRGGANEPYNVPLSMTEYRTALRSCGNTAAGADEVHYNMIKNLPDNSSEYTLALFNRIWTEQMLPTSWKLSVVLPFKKKDKDPKNINNYRPIALTSCLCKLMEKIVNARLVWYLETSDALAPEQYGFRKFRSTTDVLVRLETYIREAFARKQHVYAVFFDMEKAYDIAWRGGILQALHRTGLRGHLPEFVQSFLSNRRLTVRVGGFLSDEFDQFEGVPQGSVLSCTCFALAINSLPSVLPRYVSSSLYVDDFAIFASSNSIPALQRRMQMALNKVTTWVDEHGFRLSMEKTKVVHFTRRRGPYPDPSLTLHNTALQVTEQMRFLGLIFDRKLTWVPHVKDLKTRCLKAMDLIKCISGQKWGADRQTLMRLYQALVRSKLDYGCQAYASAAPSTLKMLDSVHHLGIRLATGAFRTSPAQSLCAESGEPSLSLRRDKLSMQLQARIVRQPGSLTCAAACNQSEELDAIFGGSVSLRPPYGRRVNQLTIELLTEIPHILPVAVAGVAPWTLPDIKVCTGMTHHLRGDAPSGALRAFFLEHQQTHSQSVPVYTDGSKSERGVGWAAVFPTSTVRGKLPDQASIFTAELSAIISTLENILDQPQTNYIIYSDSRSSLQALQHIYSDQPLIQKAHQLLHVLHFERSCDVEFCWVPAHVGVSGNETADCEAKEASEHDILAQDTRIPHRDYYPAISSAIRSKWQTRWQLQIGNKLGDIKNTVRPWETSYRRCRREEVILTRLRIGHTRMTHEFLLKGEEPPLCADCDEAQTVYHILVECHAYDAIRRRVFDPGGDQPRAFTLSNMLGDDSATIVKLMQFLRQTRLLDDI
jgi:ribonuclease HI